MSNQTGNLAYDQTGVRYADMDPFQEACQEAAHVTLRNIDRLGLRFAPGSTSLIDIGDGYIDHVEEGLGTLSHVAQAMEARLGPGVYYTIGWSAASAYLNDLLMSGAMPVSGKVHISAGDSGWFKSRERTDAIRSGWRDAFNTAGCAWTGGETASLPGIIYPDQVVVSGSVWGIIRPKERRIRGNIQAGDSIVMLPSSGYHINAVSLVRTIAERDPSFYDLRLSDGKTVGEAMLEPTYIYRDVIESCLEEGVELHAANVISGHGWRKLWYLAHLPLTYIVESLPEPQPIFQAVMEHGPVSEEEAHLQMNMGGGMALFVPHDQVVNVLKISHQLGKPAELVGTVGASDDGNRHIHLLPKGFHWTQPTRPAFA